MQVQRFDFKEFTSSSITDLDGDRPVFHKTSLRKKPEIVEETPPAPPPPAPPPEPTFSEADLKAAEMAGYQRGFAEGMEDGKKQLDAQQAELQKILLGHMEQFVTTIAPLFADYRKFCTKQGRQVPEIAMAIARKVAGPALEEGAEKIIRDMALSSCEKLFIEPKLTITIHESMGDMLAKQIEILANRMQAATDIVILRSPDMPLADCRIEWTNGAIERNTDHIWQQLEKATDNLAVSAERDTNAHLDAVRAAMNLPEEIQVEETQEEPAATPEAKKEVTQAAPAQPVNTPTASTTPQPNKPETPENAKE